MKTIDIKGRPYVEVNERLKEFRTNKKYEGWRLITEIDLLENGVCVMCAKVLNEKDEIIATGHAYEKEGSTFINKTSYIENCETSAWGRALANLGIGIDTSIASSDEVQNAIKQQEKPVITKEALQKAKDYIDEGGDLEDIKKKYKISKDQEKWLTGQK